MERAHTIVIGGGIVGVCAAYYLARRGVPVVLLEKDVIEDSASTGNAGLISIGHGPIPKPGLTGQVIRWMFDATSPLYIKPRLNLDLLRWFWRFRRACSRQCLDASMKVLTEHGWPADDCWRQLVEDEQLACEYRRNGQMDVFRTEAGMRRGEEDAAEMRDYGYEVEILHGDELRRREPAFLDSVVGAVNFPQRAIADPGEFVVEMAERAWKRGADLRPRTTVQDLLVSDGRCAGVQTDDGQRLEADNIVLAAGVWSTSLARQLGLSIPMQPAKGYHLNLTRPVPCVSTGLVLAESYVAVLPLAGLMRLAGTLELSGINHTVRQRRVDMLRIGAGKYLRNIDDTQPLSQWCGLRPCTADGLPIVGWAPKVSNLFIATGHAMMGFTLGPLAGRLACECILDGRPSADISAMRPERFA